MFVSVLMLISCQDQEPVYHSFAVDMNTFADELGDENGLASRVELASVSEYFQENDKAYFLAGSLNNYDEPLNANDIKTNFNVISSLYNSELELREAYNGVGIKTPWVSVYIVEGQGNTLIVTHIYRAPGPNVYEGDWERVEVR